VDADCDSGLCGEQSHLCEVEDAACAQHCTCNTDNGCPDGFICNPSGIAGKTCEVAH
jgi:hypothetical protein